jgi:hypothetical protein
VLAVVFIRLSHSTTLITLMSLKALCSPWEHYMSSKSFNERKWSRNADSAPSVLPIFAFRGDVPEGGPLLWGLCEKCGYEIAGKGSTEYGARPPFALALAVIELSALCIGLILAAASLAPFVCCPLSASSTAHCSGPISHRYVFRKGPYNPAHSFGLAFAAVYPERSVRLFLVRASTLHQPCSVFPYLLPSRGTKR